jgi:glucose-1-phosphate thymidylyltransferase
MKGIVLAGGTGSRLWPITRSVSKQLLPVYDKPMIYYPISTLMLAGIREILIITTPEDQALFEHLLGDGSNFGVDFAYAVQPKPEGLAQALIIGEKFLKESSCMMILGDNIFHGAGLGSEISQKLPDIGAHIFTYSVSTPNQYGILTLDSRNQPMSVEEKPLRTESNLAITGLYYFDKSASKRALEVLPSKRGELEITSVINSYLKDKQLNYTHLSRGSAWLDTGTPDSMSDAIEYVRIVETRTGQKIACLEEIALNNGWLSSAELELRSKALGNGSYNQYLQKLISEK